MRMGTKYQFFVPDELFGRLEFDELDRLALRSKEDDVADIFQNLQIIAFRARQQGLLHQHRDEDGDGGQEARDDAAQD